MKGKEKKTLMQHFVAQTDLIIMRVRVARPPLPPPPARTYEPCPETESIISVKCPCLV